MAEVLPQCQPWSCEGGDVGALILHGFTGNPSSLRPLAEKLAAEGFAVEMSLLPGHGTADWRDMAGVTWQDAARQTVAAFERLRSRCTSVVAIGLSGGAALSLRLAQTRGDELSGIVLINPTYDYVAQNPQFILLPLLKWVVPSIKGFGNDIAKPGGNEYPAERYPLKTLANLLPLQRQVRKNLHKVQVPTLVLTSRQDHVVDPGDSAKIIDRISSTDVEHVWLERSYHVATLDYDAELIQELTSKFISRVTGG
jgi:carboxylesterase